MIPIEERRRFAAYLGRVRVAGAPVAGETHYKGVMVRVPMYSAG